MYPTSPPPPPFPTPPPFDAEWYRATYPDAYESAFGRRGGSGRRARAFLVVGATVVVSMVGLAAAAVVTAGGGASSPEGAVRDFGSALDAEDVLGAFAALAPDETRSLPDAVIEAGEKLGELTSEGGQDPANEQDDDASEPTAELDIRVEGLELRTVMLSDDIAKVELVDGTVGWEFEADGAMRDIVGFAFPMADYPDSVLCADDEDCEVDEPSPTEEALDFGDATRDATQDGEPVPFVMTVKREGGWYLSPFFTVAEWARAWGPNEPVDYSSEPGPAAATPTKALESLAAAATSRDERRLADALASEMSVWRVYGEEWDAELTDVLAFDVEGLRVREEPIDEERVRVVVETATVTLTTTQPDWDAYDEAWDQAMEEGTDDELEDLDVDDYPDVEVTEVVRIDGECVRTKRSDEPKESTTGCDDDDSDGVANALGVAEVSMVAVAERDGWAISPIETIADYLRRVVDRIDRPLYERFAGWWSLGLATGEGPLWDREPSERLGAGRHDIALDSAGVAVVEFAAGEDELLRATTVDGQRAVEIVVERTWGTDVIGGAKKAVVLGRVGAPTATIVLEPIPITDLDASSGPVTGTVDEPVAYRLSADEFRRLDITVGEGADFRTVDKRGEEVFLDDQGGQPTDEPVVVIIEGWGRRAEKFRNYQLALLPETGGFGGPDPARRVIDLDEDMWDLEVKFGVRADQQVTLTVESDPTAPIEVEVYVSCVLSSWDDAPAQPDTLEIEPERARSSTVVVDEDDVCSMTFWVADEADITEGRVIATLAPR